MKIINVGYTTIREDFSEYECENGQILRAKATIANMIEKTDDEGKKKSTLGFQEISSVVTPNPIDTSDYEFMPTEQVSQEHVTGELSFKTITEIINIYETENSVIILAPIMEKILLTNKKDKDGNPILRYVLKRGISIIDKKMLQEGPPPNSPEPS